MTSDFHGSCLCGAVSYHINTPLKAVTHCHCSQCRKAHGAAFATYASVPAEALSCSDPQEVLRVFKSSPSVSRSFCSSCGASLFWANASGDYPGWVSVALGTLDTPFEPARQKHVHVQSKACWLVIGDAWPQHQ